MRSLCLTEPRLTRAAAGAAPAIVFYHPDVRCEGRSACVLCRLPIRVPGTDWLVPERSGQLHRVCIIVVCGSLDWECDPGGFLCVNSCWAPSPSLAARISEVGCFGRASRSSFSLPESKNSRTILNG